MFVLALTLFLSLSVIGLAGRHLSDHWAYVVLWVMMLLAAAWCVFSWLFG